MIIIVMMIIVRQIRFGKTTAGPLPVGPVVPVQGRNKFRITMMIVIIRQTIMMIVIIGQTIMMIVIIGPTIMMIVIIRQIIMMIVIIGQT